MSLTPVEIRHVVLPRKPLGYERTATDQLLTDIAASFENVWRERADLRDELEELESELVRQKELEQALRNTLLSAERMADDMRSQARREADVIVAVVTQASLAAKNATTTIPIVMLGVADPVGSGLVASLAVAT